MVPGPGRDAHERQVVLHRDLGDERLGAVAAGACRARRRRAPRHRGRGAWRSSPDCEDDRLDPALLRLLRELELLRLAAARLRVHRAGRAVIGGRSPRRPGSAPRRAPACGLRARTSRASWPATASTTISSKTERRRRSRDQHPRDPRSPPPRRRPTSASRIAPRRVTTNQAATAPTITSSHATSSAPRLPEQDGDERDQRRQRTRRARRARRARRSPVGVGRAHRPAPARASVRDRRAPRRRRSARASSVFFSDSTVSSLIGSRTTLRGVVLRRTPSTSPRCRPPAPKRISAEVPFVSSRLHLVEEALREAVLLGGLLDARRRRPCRRPRSRGSRAAGTGGRRADR